MRDTEETGNQGFKNPVNSHLHFNIFTEHNQHVNMKELRISLEEQQKLKNTVRGDQNV